MPRQLTTQNASITTVAVEVQALAISGKQVTLSVFRQLQEEPLISSEGTLNGVPWGHVNYHPDKCEDYRNPHWHVVWQKGSELRRARVNHTPRFDPDGHPRRIPTAFDGPECSRLLTSSVLEWLASRRPDCPLRTVHSKFYEEITYKTPYEFTANAWASDLAVTAAEKHYALETAARWAADDPAGNFSEEWLARRRQDSQDRLAAAQAAFDGALAELAAEVAVWGCTHDELVNAFRAACSEEAARRQRHRDVRSALAQLPQLFIAV